MAAFLLKEHSAFNPVTHRICPNDRCRYIIPQLEIELTRFNFRCPRCQQFRLNDFRPLFMEERLGNC